MLVRIAQKGMQYTHKRRFTMPLLSEVEYELLLNAGFPAHISTPLNNTICFHDPSGVLHCSSIKGLSIVDQRINIWLNFVSNDTVLGLKWCRTDGWRLEVKDADLMVTDLTTTVQILPA